MTDLERILLEIEVKSIEELVRFHVKKAEQEGLTKEQQTHIDDILDLLHELYQKLNNYDHT